MKLAMPRLGALLLVTLLQACGGGSSDGDGPGSGSRPRLSISATNVSVSATPGEATPVRTVTLNVTNPPATGLFVEGAYSASGIDTLDFVANSATQATLTITFRSPGSLPNGTYPDSIQLRVCTEQPCVTQISGSPANISTSYVVSGTGTSIATLDRNSIQVAANTDESSARTETVQVAVSPAAAAAVHVQASHTSNAIFQINYRNVSGSLASVDIQFRPARYLSPGNHNDTVNITVCYDPGCVRQVQGSPFIVSTSFSVGAAPEPGLTPLDVASRVALPHNVIDAEFSKALNRIVMVGSYPANALYVYDVATGTEQQQPLNRLPTAVSISPDGLIAAVGHDALITVVDLATVGQPGVPAPILLNVSTQVFDVILDGNGYVHALPRLSQGDGIHSVEIATNIEQVSTGRSIGSESRGRMHPSGNHFYTVIRASSPDDIEKWDIASGTAAWLYDSTYHGEYAMCGNVWFNESGTTIYTGCGNTFRSSEVQAQDMVYAGALALSPSNLYGWRIRSLSQSAALTEIALIEYELYHCELVPSAGTCYEHVAFYESAFLNRQAVYSLGPVTVNNVGYAQRGLFVFHDVVGTNKYLLSRLHGMPNPDAEYYLSVVP